jgi:hypothetical protein
LKVDELKGSFMVRRCFLGLPLLAFALLVWLLASCAPAAEPVAEEPVIATRLVEKEGETVVETVVVEVEEPVAEGSEVELPDLTATLAPQFSPTTAVQPTSPPVTPTPAPTIFIPLPTPLIEPRVVEVEWPGSLYLGDSDVVRMALIPTRDGYTITTEFPDHETITQDVPIIRPQGYDLYGVGRLIGVGFTVAPTTDQVRSLPLDESVVWHWSLTPQQPGRQRISVTLLLRWVPIAGSEGATQEAVAYSKGLEIRVRSFLGLTRGQAMTTGLAGVIFGSGFGLFALVYRPGRKNRASEYNHLNINACEPNRKLVIEIPSGIKLSPHDTTILKSLFSRYDRLVIRSEFLSGYSGARTFLVLPIRPDGRSDAYTIAKIGDLTSIQREHHNYETFVKDTLPPITARIQSPPVSLPSHNRGGVGGDEWAALQYTFIGEAGSTPKSLRQALLDTPDPALLTGLFKTFGPNWWMQRVPYTFRLCQEYDRALPPHYVLEPMMSRDTRLQRTEQVLDGRASPGEVHLSIGDRVTLRHFPTFERHADGQSISVKGEAVPGQAHLRIKWLGTEPGKNLVGRVVATRDELLKSYVSSFDLFGWPDPLGKLPHLLEESLVGTRSIIHGDLNLENVLVGPGAFVWLIDFATTREGHPLFDFAHLEAEIIAHVIAPQVTVGEYQAFLQSQVPGHERNVEGRLTEITATHQALFDLRTTLYDIALKCLANPSKSREYHLARYMSCLGGLKYRNLTPHQKHLLFLTAASLAAIIETDLTF